MTEQEQKEQAIKLIADFLYKKAKEDEFGSYEKDVKELLALKWPCEECKGKMYLEIAVGKMGMPTRCSDCKGTGLSDIPVVVLVNPYQHPDPLVEIYGVDLPDWMRVIRQEEKE